MLNRVLIIFSLFFIYGLQVFSLHQLRLLVGLRLQPLFLIVECVVLLLVKVLNEGFEVIELLFSFRHLLSLLTVFLVQEGRC